MTAAYYTLVDTWQQQLIWKVCLDVWLEEWTLHRTRQIPNNKGSAGVDSSILVLQLEVFVPLLPAHINNLSPVFYVQAQIVCIVLEVLDLQTGNKIINGIQLNFDQSEV